MSYSLWRIIGNDLPGRHDHGQTLLNLTHILEREVSHPECHKAFLVNRIVDPYHREMIVRTLDDYNADYSELEFDPFEYRSLRSVKNRVHYVTNVNPARNYCIREGFAMGHDYVLPFDAASMFREDGWEQFHTQVSSIADRPYYILGQWRVPDLRSAIDCTIPPILREEYSFGDTTKIGMREFTIAFGKDFDYNFNGDTIYPLGDKVDLLWRLGVPGVWDEWHPEAKKEALKSKSKYFGTISMAGWVSRLPSGIRQADEDNRVRGQLRSTGIRLLLEKANARH